MSDLIEHLYKNAFAQDKNITDPAAVEPAIQKRMEFLQRYQTADRSAPHGGLEIDAFGRRRDLPPSTPRELHSLVLTARAARYVRHVDEGERIAFLKRYEADVNRLQAELTHYKNDRGIWLKDYFKNDQAGRFGSAFLRYETDASMAPEQKESGNSVPAAAPTAAEIGRSTSSTLHALAFASCVEGMMWGVETLSDGLEDRERKLLNQWWAGTPEANPFLLNLAYDRGLDAAWGAAGTTAVVGALSTAARPVLTHVALEHLMGQVNVYFVSRFVNRTQSSRQNLRGAAWQTLAERIHTLADGVSEANANRLVEILETRHRDKIVPMQITRQEVARALEEAANMPRGAIAVNHADDLIRVWVWQGAGEATRNRYYLPAVESGLTGVAALLAFYNLYATVRDLELDKMTKASWSNLAAAVLGTGSAINAALAVAETRLPRGFARVGPASDLIFRRLAGLTALRLFGYGAAIADGITHGFKANEQYAIGNTMASNYYAVSGLLLGLSGAALTHAAVLASVAATAGVLATASAMVPVVGWAVAGVLLLGAGAYTVGLAMESEYTEIEYWLNDCIFGLHKQEMTRAVYPWASTEILGFYTAYYVPRLIKETWTHAVDPDKPAVKGVGLAARYREQPQVTPVLMLQFVYPLEGEIHPPVISAASGKLPRCRSAAAFSSGPYQACHLFDLKQAEGVALTFSYTPSILGEPLKMTYAVDLEKAPWRW
ncbi:MAG: hypothetical protein LBI68_09235 [Azoarcus sp.]|nr:hypothetical protein [Azoarcus sp.]